MPRFPMGRGNFQGEGATYCKKNMDALPWAVEKTAEPIDMPIAMLSEVGLGYHVLDGAHIRHTKGQFWGEKGWPIAKYRDCVPWAVQRIAEPIEMPFEIWTRMGPKKHLLDRDAHWRHLANWTVRVRRQCGLLSNYFDHLFFCVVIIASDTYWRGGVKLCPSMSDSVCLFLSKITYNFFRCIFLKFAVTGYIACRLYTSSSSFICHKKHDL